MIIGNMIIEIEMFAVKSKLNYLATCQAAKLLRTYSLS